ncbi:long-chain fatty acid--CoA ligase [Desulfosporosinus sp.]|uniref:long-chain fatty acid--CoA ligase n=1 Tax=Desulfosporosinus sp. TaxID=157907 RepID=UPI0025BA64A2|nr:long-chain fatty acid--CoA ligase [Desulfosporosinus sp.]
MKYWPKRLATTLPVPETSVYDNLAVSARRYPNKTAIHYYSGSITYRRFKEEVDALAGLLQQQLGVAKGDRVIIFMQNSPQFIIAYYAILRANAVVVPINPMNITEELAIYIEDSEAKIAFVAQELYDQVAPLPQRTPLQHVIVVTYSDYLEKDYDLQIPPEVLVPNRTFAGDVIYWRDAIALGLEPGPHLLGAEDMAILPYTSGTTGKPKGCVHSHQNLNTNTVSSAAWRDLTVSSVTLTTLPLYHVTGMMHSMNAPIFVGSTIVLMSRWNRDLAAALVQRHGCTHWTNISTMVVDFLANPSLSNYNVKSLLSVGGGGAPLPEAIGEKLFRLLGTHYTEGYGLSETISQTHMNPPERPKLQCIGIPIFDVDARVIDPDTLQELGPNEQGELVINGPQMLKEYWRRPEETKKAFIELEGKKFLRTGDIARYDEEGYFFMVDRVKRMINASGFKVWPAEVESVLYRHPAIQQACVIGIPDPHRGETVKAYVILKQDERGEYCEQDIIEWAKEHMAAYKYPRLVQFVDSFPMSASGKLQWRKLQEDELKKIKR